MRLTDFLSLLSEREVIYLLRTRQDYIKRFPKRRKAVLTKPQPAKE